MTLGVNNQELWPSSIRQPPEGPKSGQNRRRPFRITASGAAPILWPVAGNQVQLARRGGWQGAPGRGGTDVFLLLEDCVRKSTPTGKRRDLGKKEPEMRPPNSAA